MVLALIRPGKKHLQSLCIERGFDSIRDEIWQQDAGYTFKRSHSLSYAMLVYVHANLLLEQAAAVAP
jgi:DNA polymerase III alpha subunit